LNLSSSNDIASASNPCDDGPQIGSSANHVVYSPSTNSSLGNLTQSSENNDFLTGSGTYILEDVFASDPNSLNSQRDNPQVFDGIGFLVKEMEDVKTTELLPRLLGVGPSSTIQTH